MIIHICRESDKCYVRRCVYIHGNRTKKTCNGGHRTIKKGASTDPKKHFEVINFILGHFVNFLEEIYQEKFLDVSSPVNKPSEEHACTMWPAPCVVMRNTGNRAPRFPIFSALKIYFSLFYFPSSFFLHLF